MQTSDNDYYPPNEHVNEIERSIRTMKERSRCFCHALPYTRYPKDMTKHLMHEVTSWLNSFPTNDSICTNMSPAMIVEGKPKPDVSKKIIPFGSYAMVYTSTSNNMKSRAIEGIALSSAGPKGGYYFLSLQTGKRIHGYSWTTLPITDAVINDVHELAAYEKQPSMPNKGEPIYEWNPGRAINDPIYNDNEDIEFENENDNIINLNDNENENIDYDLHEENESENEHLHPLTITDNSSNNDDGIDESDTETEEDDSFDNNENNDNEMIDGYRNMDTTNEQSNESLDE